jgi:hypothetical protein
MEPGHTAHSAFFGGCSSYLDAFRHIACVVEQFIDEINGEMAMDLEEPLEELFEKIPQHSYLCDKATDTADDFHNIALVRAPTPVDDTKRQPKGTIPFRKEARPADRDSAIDISPPPSPSPTIRARPQKTYERIPYDEEDTWSDYESHAASRARCRARKTAATQRKQETATRPSSHQPTEPISTTPSSTTRDWEEERQPRPQRAQTPAEKEAAALERKKRVAAVVQHSKSAIAALKHGRGGAWTPDSFVDPSGRLGLAYEKHQALRRTYIAGQPDAFGLPRCTWRKSAVVLQAPTAEEGSAAVAAAPVPTIRLTDSQGCEWSLRDSRSYEVVEEAVDDAILGWRPGHSRNREALRFSLLGIRELQMKRAAEQGDRC